MEIIKKQPWNTVRLLLVIGAIVLALAALFAWSRALFPIMGGLLVAYIAHPLANYFEKKGWPRILGFIVILLLFAALIFVVFFILIPGIIHELINISGNFADWRKALEVRVGHLLGDLERRYPEAYALLEDHLTRWAQENLPSLAERMLKWLMGVLGSAIGLAAVFLNMVLIPVIGAYLTVDFRKVTRYLMLLVPRPVLPLVQGIALEINQVLWNFIRGQMVIAVALGVMYTIGLLVVDAPMALVIGPLAGLFGLIPYLGFVLGLGSAALLSFLEHQDLWHPTGVVITFTVAQTIEGWILTPRLLGNRVGLHPAWILVSLLLGGELFGFPGLIIAVPVAACLRVILLHALSAYRGSLLYGGTPPHFVFYTREKCLLCEEFEILLESFLKPRGLSFQRVDVDSSAELVERFGTRIPVLEVDGGILAEGRIAHRELHAILEEVLDIKKEPNLPR